VRVSILGFSKNELRGTVVILLVLFAVIGLNLRVSLRKARDAQRRSDVSSISDGVKAFQADFGFFPKSFEGKIVACEGELDSKGDPVFKPCEWLYDSLRDNFDSSYPAYIEHIPTDPHHNSGARYYYVSNGSRFQIYGTYESDTEPEYDEGVVGRNLNCGNRVCNFGKAYADTPVDISIEQYESELIRE
jgi:hypothetical protein